MNGHLVDARFVSHLAFEVPSASLARQLLGGLLRASGTEPSCVQDAELVVFELVMNGVVHGSAGADHALLVEWAIAERVLRVTVQDNGVDASIAAMEPTSDRPGGRGLALVEALSQRWSCERVVDGTRVSAWLTVH